MCYKLHSLTIRNFVVFADEFVINFDKHMLNHIEAEFKGDPNQSNGAGKSSLLDAISLALFGKGVRFNHLADYVAPSNPDGGVYLNLELINTVDNSILKIERWRKPKSNSNKARLWSNGKLLTKDSTVTAVDDLLSEYLGVTHSNFMSCIFSVMLPGFLTMRPAQRFETLENALAVKKLDLILKKINAQLKTTNDRLDETNTVLTEKRQLLGQELARKDIFAQNKEKLASSIELQKQELSSLYEQEISLTDKKAQLVLLRTEATNKQAKQASNISDIKASKHSVESQLSVISKDKKSITDNLTNTGNSVECKVCHSSLDMSSKDSLISHYDIEIATLNDRLITLDEMLSGATLSYNSITKTLNKIVSNLSSIDSDLSISRSSSIACEKTIRITTESLQLAENSFDATSMNILISEVTDLVAQRDTLQKDVKMISAWKQAMSKNGLRLAYLKEEVGLLSAITSKFATSVYNTPTEVKFFITDDRDTPTIDFTVNGKSANAFSTGERKLLEITITLSLMTLLKTNGMTLQTLILDEALDGLSTSSKNNVVAVIKQLSADNQVISISHDPMLKALSGNVIKIIKDITTNTSVIENHQR